MNTKYIFLIILRFFSFGDLLAQEYTTDSLRSELKYAVGQNRLIILNQLALNLREHSQQEAFDFALEAEKLAQELNDKTQESKAKENIGWIYYRRGKWQKTFDYSSKSYKLAIEGGDPKQAASVLNNMGALYYEQRDFKTAREQFEKAYQISRQEDDTYTMTRSLNNIAFTFIQLNELDSSLHYAEKVIQFSKGSDAKYLVSYATRIIGDVHFKREEYEKAEQVYNEALEMAEDGGATSYKSSILHRLGKTYLELTQNEKARVSLEEAIRISKEHDYIDELSKAKKYLAKYYEQIGDYKAAYNEQSEYIVLDDSLVNQITQDRIALMHGMFQENLNQSELELLIAQNENQATRIESIRKVGILIGVTSLIVFILLIWLFYLNRNVKKANLDLLEQKQHIFEQNQSLELTSQKLKEINQTKNKLFSILGHDLKGPVGQVKTVVDLLLTGDLNREEFNELVNMLKLDVETVHLTLDNTLKWSITQMEGFSISRSNVNLHQLVRNNLKLFQPQLREKLLTVSDEIDRDYKIYADPDLVEVVIRNVLNNAIKFSPESTKITLSYILLDETVLFTVQDQGVGIDENKINQILNDNYTILPSQLGTKREKGSGLGLQISKEFIRLNNGKLVIQSQKEVGTKVTLTLPVGLD